ncbi:MAG: DNA repair protein RecN [Beijerinckiaceae bacterium]|nr:DNA repair protein RecN [Beijerinckiaceae bacterium]
MLVQLSIRDIVLIDRLDIEPGSGLTVLTGETGAGKSILLDAFSLALGGRGDGSLVRADQAQGQVTAAFDLPEGHRALAAAREAGAESSGELILRRVQMADGRTRAFVNDQPISVQALRTIGSALVEIHGQHDDRALVDPAMHRAVIDSAGGLETDVAAVRAAYATARENRSALAREEERIDVARKEADWLRHAHDELTKLAPAANEERDLADKRTGMMQAEKVAVELRDANDMMSGNHAPGAAMLSLLRRLDRRAAQAPALLDPSVKALDAALTAVDLAAQTIQEALRACGFDPRDLERIEERLFALRAAGRKYAAPVDDLAALAEKYADDLAALDAGEVNLVKLRKAADAADARFAALAAALSKARAKAASVLDKAVNAELAPLKLEQARFTTQITVDAAMPGPDGVDRVEFWVQTNPGTRPGPLMKIASGGELARFMLALKVVLADKGSAPTLVFDEIDTGVGGAVADAIGQRLARLAARVQVLAVTHAPQVAARAAGHLRIAKAVADKGKRVSTRVEALAEDARREEIARMLAGATITEEARAAARRLIESAQA